MAGVQARPQETGGDRMSKSGQAFVAATEGHVFTLYAVMKAIGLPLTPEQEKFQAYLEKNYPAIVKKGCQND